MYVVSGWLVVCGFFLTLVSGLFSISAALFGVVSVVLVVWVVLVVAVLIGFVVCWFVWFILVRFGLGVAMLMPGCIGFRFGYSSCGLFGLMLRGLWVGWLVVSRLLRLQCF